MIPTPSCTIVCFTSSTSLVLDAALLKLSQCTQVTDQRQIARHEDAEKARQRYWKVKDEAKAKMKIVGLRSTMTSTSVEPVSFKRNDQYSLFTVC